jgi:membrane protease subunit (stomatin/prohibitin family)
LIFPFQEGRIMPDGLRQHLRSIIELPSASPDFLFTLWSDNEEEIKNASTLILGPGQGCAFVYEGSIRAIYSRRGMVTLATAALPFWTIVSKFMQFFQNEHNVGIYFFRTLPTMNQKWTPSSPIRYEDPVYGFPVGLRISGNFSIHLIDPRGFFTSLVAGRPALRTEDLRKIIADKLVQPLNDSMAQARISFAQIDAKREEIAWRLISKMQPEFRKQGFILEDFRIDNAEFDEETQSRIKRIAGMTGVAPTANQTGLFKGARTMEPPSETALCGGSTGAGTGIDIDRIVSAASQTQVVAIDASDSIKLKLVELKDLFDSKLITDGEYATKRQMLLSLL